MGYTCLTARQGHRQQEGSCQVHRPSYRQSICQVVGREPSLPWPQQAHLGEVALHPTEDEQGVDKITRCEDRVDGSRHDDQGGGTIDIISEHEAHRYV